MTASEQLIDSQVLVSIRKLLDIQAGIIAALPAPIIALTAADVRQRMAEDMPLISFDDFYPGWESAQQALHQVTKWASDSDSTLLSLVENLDESLFRDLAETWYSAIETEPVGQNKLVALAGASLKPFLEARSRQLVSLVDQSLWRQKICPVCRAKADFGYIDGENGARWLMCSRCDSTWLFHRLKCPHCDTEDQSKVSYYLDSTERYRLYVCDECHRYLKSIDMRKVPRDIDLALERFVTISLDIEASCKGYRP